jgi:hypothetical protein
LHLGRRGFLISTTCFGKGKVWFLFCLGGEVQWVGERGTGESQRETLSLRRLLRTLLSLIHSSQHAKWHIECHILSPNRWYSIILKLLSTKTLPLKLLSPSLSISHDNSLKISNLYLILCI